jgi:hypothetical protein
MRRIVRAHPTLQDVVRGSAPAVLILKSRLVPKARDAAQEERRRLMLATPKNRRRTGRNPVMKLRQPEKVRRRRNLGRVAREARLPKNPAETTTKNLNGAAPPSIPGLRGARIQELRAPSATRRHQRLGRNAASAQPLPNRKDRQPPRSATKAIRRSTKKCPRARRRKTRTRRNLLS